jgi:hypothetical protein
MQNPTPELETGNSTKAAVRENRLRWIEPNDLGRMVAGRATHPAQVLERKPRRPDVRTRSSAIARDDTLRLHSPRRVEVRLAADQQLRA